MLKWGRVALKWLGRSPGRCRSPSPAQSQGGCTAGTGQGTGVPPHSPAPRGQAWRAAQRAAPGSLTEPESHAQHEKGEEKVTITTSATTSPRGNDHLTATLHTTGGREDGERSLVGLGNRELVLEHGGGHGQGSSASPERDLLLGFQFPHRPRAPALRVPILGSLGCMAPAQFSAFCAAVAFEVIRFSA